MIRTTEHKIKLMKKLLIEILINYIDKFTIYQIPHYLQFIHYFHSLTTISSDTLLYLVIPTIVDNLIKDLKEIDKLLEIRNLIQLKISDNFIHYLQKISKLCFTFNNAIESESEFINLYNHILGLTYMSSISFKQYSTINNTDMLVTTTTKKKYNILVDKEFLKYHKQRQLDINIKNRRIFG